MLSKSGVEILIDHGIERMTESLAWCDVVMDGLFGTGIAQEVEEHFREVIHQCIRAWNWAASSS